LKKPTRPGFYLVSHFSGFLGNTGVGIILLLAVAVAAFMRFRDARTKIIAFLALAGAFYLAPLFLGTPADITAVRGYMLMGIVLWIWAAVLVIDGLAAKGPAGMRVLTALCLLLTVWGTVGASSVSTGVLTPLWSRSTGAGSSQNRAPKRPATSCARDWRRG
jgi:hypothetical protein